MDRAFFMLEKIRTISLVFLPVVIVFSILFFNSSILAQETMDHRSMNIEETESGGTFSNELLALGLEFINFTLGAIAIMVIAIVHSQHKKPNTSYSLIYFLLGTVFLGVIRLFLILTSLHIIRLQEENVTIIWHIIFYFAMVSFLIGAVDLIHLSKVSNELHPSLKLSRLASILFGGSAIIFIIVFFIHPASFNIFQARFWEQYGVHHFVAFLFAGTLAFYIAKLRKSTNNSIAMIAMPLLWSFAFFSAIHLWELVTESYKIILVPEDIIERVEQLLTIPGYGFIIYTFIQRPSETDDSYKSTSDAYVQNQPRI